jgi:DNA-binding NtrC family response regulator
VEGFAVGTAESANKALEKLEKTKFDLILSDVKMPNKDGNELLDEILEKNKNAIVILMTAFGSIENAVQAVKRGATDYISKPFQMEEVILRIRRALKERNLEQKVADLEEQLNNQNPTAKIIGKSP